uniref:Tartrate transporter n=1 Tax=Mycena chlorophos TaxID=658473 RepID=A0ABQ0LHC0_MYCCL|nr:tartrate transporter [Mycena chlorophos]
MPALYFSRVARIFQDAEVSRPDIQRMVDAAYASAPANIGTATGTGRDYELDEILLSNNAPSNRTSVVEGRLGDDTGLTPALVRFKHSWEDFVTSLIKEWKTLNVVSALLLSAILTLLQIAPALASPTTRTLSLLSLVCALMSLCYGCVYIVRFATMRSMARAARFAEEARKTYTAIWWNVWTLLAMPAVWLAWAVVWFVGAVLAFVWGTASLDGEEDGDAAESGGGTGKLALVERVVITTVLGVGLVYFALIVVSLARYTGAPSKRPPKEDASASPGRVPVPVGRDAQSAAELGLGMGLRSGSPDLAPVVDGTERGRRAAKAGWGAAAGPGTGSGSLRAVAAHATSKSPTAALRLSAVTRSQSATTEILRRSRCNSKGSTSAHTHLRRASSGWAHIPRRFMSAENPALRPTAVHTSEKPASTNSDATAKSSITAVPLEDIDLDLPSPMAVRAHTYQSTTSDVEQTPSQIIRRQEAEKNLLRKLDMRLIPAIFVIYVMNYVNRTAITAARLKGLEHDLHLTDIQYNVVLSILFITLSLAQPPSNMILNKVTRPSVYIGCCVIAWGLASALSGVVTNYAGILVCRLFIGLPEASFYPGAVYLLSCWYTKKELAIRTAILFSGLDIANAFGALVAAAILERMEGVCGIQGWRWLFMIEGCTTIFLGFLVMWLLPDYPRNTRWINDHESRLAQARLAKDAGEADQDTEAGSRFEGLKLACADPLTWLFSLMLFTQHLGRSVGQFFPTLAKTLGYSTTTTLLLTAPPWLLAAFICVLSAWHADRTGERFHHISIWILAMMVGFVINLCTMSVAARYCAMFLMAIGDAGCAMTLVWVSNSIPRPPAKRAAAIGITNGIGNVGMLSVPLPSQSNI